MIRASEATEVSIKKLDVMESIVVQSRAPEALREIIKQVRHNKKVVRVRAVRALGECGRRMTEQVERNKLNSSLKYFRLSLLCLRSRMML
jgi:HEAT repeat protein